MNSNIGINGEKRTETLGGFVNSTPLVKAIPKETVR